MAAKDLSNESAPPAIVTPNETELFLDEKLFQERNLLRIKGYLFNFWTKKSSSRPDSLRIIEKSIKLPTGNTLFDQPLLFETNPTYGWPEELSSRIRRMALPFPST